MKKYILTFGILFLLIFVISAYAGDMDVAIREADKKLQANGFLLEDEIDEILEAEQTPDVLSKVTDDQQKAIVAELREAQEINARESRKLGLGIADQLEQSIYQDGVFKNKMLKARRAIAKKYGIQAGDITAIEFHVMYPD